MNKILLLLSLTSISLTSAFAQTTGYTMTCVFDGTQTVSIRPSLSEPTKWTIGFGFKRATKPATQGVEPGTCAWDDRAMSNDEPTIILQILDRIDFRYFEIKHKGVPQLVMTPSMALWAAQAMTPGYTIKFKVFQSTPNHGLAANYFQITDR